MSSKICLIYITCCILLISSKGAGSAEDEEESSNEGSRSVLSKKFGGDLNMEYGANISSLLAEDRFYGSSEASSLFDVDDDFNPGLNNPPTILENGTDKPVSIWTQDIHQDKDMYGKQIIFTDHKGNGWKSNFGGSDWAGGNRGKGWAGHGSTPTKGKKGGYGGVGNGNGPSVHKEPEKPVLSPAIVFCSLKDKCWHFVHCASHNQKYLKLKDRCCAITLETKGMCCIGLSSGLSLTEYDDDESIPTEPIGHHFRPYTTTVIRIHTIPDESLHNAAEKGSEYKEEYKNIEIQLLELGIVVKPGTASFGHLQFFQTTPVVLKIAVDNILVVKATTYVQDKYFLTAAQAGIGLQAYSFIQTILGSTCPPRPICSEYATKYRTPDGSCNNFNIPKLGQSNTPLLRLLPPDYADGIWAPRVRKDGGPLPSPRFITRNLVPDMDNPDFRYSHLLTQFGQFIDHDLTHVPIFRLNDMNGIECCGNGESSGNGGGGGRGGYGGLKSSDQESETKQYRTHNEEKDYEDNILQHPACFPIPLDPSDPKFRGRTCMNFVRSMIAPRLDCTFGHADQLNQVTHWLDGSQIYGNTYEQMESLREFSGGLLRVTRDTNGQHLLPLDFADQSDCSGSGNSNGNQLHCFIAGDRRVNEQIALTSVHTIWLREHNRVATELRQFHHDWNDELLFQEARRIVVAEYQHIVYNEWLPIVIGRRYMEVFQILPFGEGYYTGHDVLTEPTISNAFATAAFRLHTLVSGWLDIHGENGIGRLLLRNYFNNPHLLRENGALDGITQGLLTQPMQRFDPYVTTELRDHLFESSSGVGFDLIALNIQRGRDHGLPSYNEYRDLCRLGKARSFNELAPIILTHKVQRLQQVYEDVNDIDLFVGGIHEQPVEGALVGPTFLCIIGDQFARLKKSDRFFYDVGGTKHSFTKSQLQAIRQVSMARVICDNTEEIRSIQPLAFHLPNSGYNPIFPCGSPSIPRLDLLQWA